MSTPIKDLIEVSLTFTIALYGSLYLFGEVLRTIFPPGILLTVLIGGCIYFFRIPSPSQEAVEAIIGKELHLDGNGYVMKSVAHRGAGLDAPENTLSAFNYCKEKGCDTIELDVQLTGDNVPVIFHDSTLERMTDLNLSIKGTKFADLVNIDLSVKHPLKERFYKTHIPALDEAVVSLLANGQRMFIDIKDSDKKIVPFIIQLYEKYPNLYSRAVVSSFFPHIIYLVRKADPKIVCSMAWRPNIFAYESYNYPIGKGVKRYQSLWKHYFYCILDILHEWAFHKIIYYFLGLSIVLLHKDVADGKSVLEWRKRGIRVMIFSANTPVDKQYFARSLKITYLTDTLIGEGTTHYPPE